MRRYLIAGNWKMNTNRDTAVSLAKSIADGSQAATGSVDVLVCPPFPYLIPVQDAASESQVTVGAQNCYFEEPGAFTGEVAAEMLADLGIQSVILGHSERRHVLGETDAIINRKVLKSLEKGLQVVLCVGELLEEREAEKTNDVLDEQMAGGLASVSAEQMANVVIAYEPVWAIGTGKTASPEQADSAHAHLRKWLESHYTSEIANGMRILYGGSVKPANAVELLSQENVDGALVGGASLTAENFVPIIEAGASLSK
ncbi:Triosephosphate isomerase [Thalassoglobus neptunius]|uniref:Triosephosphate isomerase n=1 Tax=Thalassoglobus neptunius TaxID=1938619 RepID=A0A5C5WN44_9PLAN|nr:triose-phosphate isomerase [Thalassoglobus neptunius]TWT52234.1 Triosephosphate isomerase [Thalassoglobus neptunius]